MFETGDEFPRTDEGEWLDKARAALRGRDPLELTRHTFEGLPIAPVYGPRRPLPMPPRPRPLARDHGWAVMGRVDVPGGDAAPAARAELEGGCDGLTMVLAEAAPNGFGLGLDDMEAALDGLEPELFPLALDAGERWPEAASRLLGLYHERRYDLSRAPLLLDADPFRTGRGDAAAMTALAGRARELGFAGALFAADTRLIHARGCGEAGEVAYAAAATVEILRRLDEAGFAAAESARAIAWLITADADQFLTVAKLRAARLVHWRILSAAGITGAPLLLRAESAWRMLTRDDPWVNMLRGASAVFAAALGGADAVTLHPFTAALGLSDDFARRMARNTQLIALEEARLDMVHDPLAGSGFIENLTAELARRAWEIFQSIEAQGGLSAAIEDGFIDEMIEETAQKRRAAIARRELPITGVSEFPSLGEEAPAVLAAAELSGGWPRDARPFEELRAAARDYRARHGHWPRLFIATLGEQARHGARLNWLRNLLAAGGIEGLSGGVEEFAASGCDLAALCGADDSYAREGEAALASLRAAGARKVWLAGRGSGIEADGELSAGMDVLSFLRRLHRLLEVAS